MSNNKEEKNELNSNETEQPANVEDTDSSETEYSATDDIRVPGAQTNVSKEPEANTTKSKGSESKEPESHKMEDFSKKAAETASKAAETASKAAETASKFAEKSYDKIKDFDPRTSVKMLDSFIEWMRNIFPPEKFEALSEWCIKHGHAGIVAAQILSLVFGLFSALTLRRPMLILFGIGTAILLAILQYSADKFIRAGKTLIDASPSRLGSMAFLDCTFLLLEVSGLLIFLVFLKDGLVSGLVGLGLWALCDAIAYIALYPSMVNIEVTEDTRAGEEAIGIMSFLAKAILRIVPIAFGIGAIIGTLALLIGIFSLMLGYGASAGNRALFLVILCSCLPFFSYVFFMIYHLTIDILRAILLVPHKLDELKNKEIK